MSEQREPKLIVFGVHDGPLDQSRLARILRWLTEGPCDDQCCVGKPRHGLARLIRGKWDD